MREVKRSALVAQPSARLFALISDVARYPEFVPGCTHARIESRSEQEIVATLGVRSGALRAEFTTRNELEPDRRVTMHLLRGPFSVLEGEWLLTPIADSGCHVDLASASHFLSNTTSLGEACAVCHSSGAAYAVDQVHAQY